jgi:EAL domain-containing protein (putative c-di-GMP-specific phosphodiesterase class I)
LLECIRVSVAQFVENADSLKILTNSGIDFAQGFGVARPHSIDLLQ